MAAGISLYQPRDITDPVHHPDISDAEVYWQDITRILESDLVIFLADEPSTGSGQEIFLAHSALIPVVVIAHEDTHISRMVLGMLGPADQVTRYREVSDLRSSLGDFFGSLATRVAPRESALAEIRRVGLDTRVTRALESSSATYAAGRLPPTEGLSLMQLAELASRAGMTLSDLFGE